MPLAHLILGLQGIIGRNVPAIDTAVLSIGSVQGGDPGSPNVIPAEVALYGTARSYKPEIRDLLEKRLRDLSQTFAQAYGCTAEVDYQRRYPPLVNHTEQTEASVAAARTLVGADKVLPEAPLITGSEDFAFMLEARPGSFIMIGNGVNPDGSSHDVHTPNYDFNDQILTLGSSYWVTLVQQELV